MATDPSCIPDTRTGSSATGNATLPCCLTDACLATARSCCVPANRAAASSDSCFCSVLGVAATCCCKVCTASAAPTGSCSNVNELVASTAGVSSCCGAVIRTISFAAAGSPGFIDTSVDVFAAGRIRS